MEVKTRDLEELPAGLESEAIFAELTETVELQAVKLEALGEEIEHLQQERGGLAAELHMARAWIRELAAELQWADPPREPSNGTLRERIHGQA